MYNEDITNYPCRRSTRHIIRFSAVGVRDNAVARSNLKVVSEFARYVPPLRHTRQHTRLKAV